MIEKLRNYLAQRTDVQDMTKISQKLINFIIGGKSYLAEYDREQDPEFFRIMLPLVEHIEDSEYDKISNLIAKISTNFKVGKAIIIEDYVWLSAEVFVYDTRTANMLFTRLILLLDAMFDEYKNLRNNGK